jgi:hypothetical protein
MLRSAAPFPRAAASARVPLLPRMPPSRPDAPATFRDAGSILNPCRELSCFFASETTPALFEVCLGLAVFAMLITCSKQSTKKKSVHAERVAGTFPGKVPATSKKLDPPFTPEPVRHSSQAQACCDTPGIQAQQSLSSRLSSHFRNIHGPSTSVDYRWYR